MWQSVAALKFARTCGGHLLLQVSAVSRSKASFIKAETLGINNYFRAYRPRQQIKQTHFVSDIGATSASLQY